MMGVSAIKKRFNISHIVKKRNGEILISSWAISGIITISSNGDVRFYDRDFSSPDLRRYWIELNQCDKEELARLVNEPETITTPMDIYTTDRRKVIKTLCEFIPEDKSVWLNVDIDGNLMHENTHFRKRSEAKEDLKGGTIAWLKMSSERVKSALIELLKVLGLFAKCLYNFIYVHITY